MDLPYVFKGDGEQTEMQLNPEMNLDAFIQQISGKLQEVLKAKFGFQVIYRHFEEELGIQDELSRCSRDR